MRSTVSPLWFDVSHFEISENASNSPIDSLVFYRVVNAMYVEAKLAGIISSSVRLSSYSRNLL